MSKPDPHLSVQLPNPHSGREHPGKEREEEEETFISQFVGEHEEP